MMFGGNQMVWPFRQMRLNQNALYLRPMRTQIIYYIVRGLRIEIKLYSIL